MDSSFVLPQVLHLSRTEEHLYARTRSFLSSCEFINYLLTSETRAILHADDALRWYWTEEILTCLGLDRAKFPPFCRPGDLVGVVTRLPPGLGLRMGFLSSPQGPISSSHPGLPVRSAGDGLRRWGPARGFNLCYATPWGTSG